ncbi:unnamed protein product [Prorocentrum cordatum]|uniref:Uncharacterized protein n=1 Tax=Prorocentrum cordatum TaxID=2364126 RepID=A0ABN9S5H6_9DINO|nr:unnamed protein product [Polarella glacialis]
MPPAIELGAAMFGGGELTPWAGAVIAPERAAAESADSAGSQAKQAKGNGKGEQSLLRKVAALSMATAREQAVLSSVVLSTFLVPSESYLAKNGLAANKIYSDTVKKIHDRKGAGEEVDLDSPGPPLIAVFFLSARAMMTQGSDQKYLKDQTPQCMASLVRQFAARAPRGPGSKRTQGKVMLTLALGPNPEAQAVNAMMDLALAACKAVQMALKGRESSDGSCASGCSSAASSATGGNDSGTASWRFSRSGGCSGARRGCQSTAADLRGVLLRAGWACSVEQLGDGTHLRAAGPGPGKRLSAGRNTSAPPIGGALAAPPELRGCDSRCSTAATSTPRGCVASLGEQRQRSGFDVGSQGAARPLRAGARASCEAEPDRAHLKRYMVRSSQGGASQIEGREVSPAVDDAGSGAEESVALLREHVNHDLAAVGRYAELVMRDGVAPFPGCMLGTSPQHFGSQTGAHDTSQQKSPCTPKPLPSDTNGPSSAPPRVRPPRLASSSSPAALAAGVAAAPPSADARRTVGAAPVAAAGGAREAQRPPGGEAAGESSAVNPELQTTLARRTRACSGGRSFSVWSFRRGGAAAAQKRYEVP